MIWNSFNDLFKLIQAGEKKKNWKQCIVSLITARKKVMIVSEHVVWQLQFSKQKSIFLLLCVKCCAGF